MSTPNAGRFVPTLCILLPLLTLPFLLAQEANMTDITTDQTQNTTMEMARTNPAPTPAGVSPSMAVATQGPQPTVVLTTMEEPFTGDLKIQSQGMEGNSTPTAPAAIQSSNNPTEAETGTASSWSPTSRLPESATLPAPDDVLGLSTSVEFTMTAEGTTEATAHTAITTAATTGLATATRSTALTPSSERLPPATPSASESSGDEATFTTTSSGTAADAATPPEVFFVFPTDQDYDEFPSPGPTQPPHHLTTHAVVVGPKPNRQKSDPLWVALVVLLAVAICVGGAVCLGLLVKRRRRRSQVLHLSGHGYRNNKGKEGEAWAGPVTMRSGVAADTVREECEGEAEENAEGKSKDAGEDGMLLSTFGVEGKGRASPDGQGGIGGTGSKEARKWEDESPLLYIDEDKVEVDTKVGATPLEGGGGGGGDGEKVIGEEMAKEKEEEKDRKGLNENEESNGGKAFSYITSV